MAAKRRYRLKHPIVVVSLADGAEKTTSIAEVVLADRIKGRHLRAADAAAGPASGKLLMLGALVGLTAREMDEMDAEDVETLDAIYEERPEALAQVIVDPLADGPSTGQTSSAT